MFSTIGGERLEAMNLDGMNLASGCFEETLFFLAFIESVMREVFCLVSFFALLLVLAVFFDWPWPRLAGAFAGGFPFILAKALALASSGFFFFFLASFDGVGG